MGRYGEQLDTEQQTENTQTISDQTVRVQTINAQTVTMSEKPLAAFQVITDTHVRDDADHIYNRHFQQALADIASFCEGSLGVMHAGDVTDRGLASEYREFRRIWIGRPAAVPDLYVTLGNHDIGAVLWEESGKPIDLSTLSGAEIEDALDGRFPDNATGNTNTSEAIQEEKASSDNADKAEEKVEAAFKDSSGNENADAGDVHPISAAETGDVRPLSAAEALAESAAAAGLDLSGLAARLSDAGEAGSPARELWKRRMRHFAEGTGEAAPYHDHWLGGYHFIFLGSESPHPKDCDLSAAQLEWLKECLAEEASPDRPVFVFLHQPLMDTVAGSMQSQGWFGVNQDAELKQVLSACPQAILFTGHTHWQLEAQRTMYDGQGVMPSMFNASSVAYLWTDGDEHLTGSEGLQVEIYHDRVTVRGRDFVKGTWIEGAEYTVKYPVGSSAESTLS